MRFLKATVIAVDELHVVILCPICGRLHAHGSNGDATQLNYGHRMPHCTDFRPPWARSAYEANPRGDSYVLVCEPRTRRFNDRDSARRCAGQWYKQHMATAFKVTCRDVASQAKAQAKKDHPMPTRAAYINMAEYVKSALIDRSIAQRMELEEREVEP